MTTTHVEHANHTHVHAEGGGHVAVPHADHVESLDDGYHHAFRAGH